MEEAVLDHHTLVPTIGPGPMCPALLQQEGVVGMGGSQFSAEAGQSAQASVPTGWHGGNHAFCLSLLLLPVLRPPLPPS